MQITNPDRVLRTRPSKDVTVSITINVDKDSPDHLILQNAIEALYYVVNNRDGAEYPIWKVWALKIVTETVKVFT
jgi:hypothetical protein